MPQALRLALVVICLQLSPQLALAFLDDTTWALGFWQQISDEDHAVVDYFEIRPDGTVVSYGICANGRPGAHRLSTWHIHNGDIYQTIEVEGKGPIALVFRPNKDRSRITFTSPRSKNNAVYEHRPTDPCVSG